MATNSTKTLTAGARCVCGQRHTAYEQTYLPIWQHWDAPDHILAARSIARRLIRLARLNGCEIIHVWSEGALLEQSQRENDIVNAMCHVVDDCTVEFLGKRDVTQKRAPRPQLSRMLWIPENGRDAMSDWTITPWAERVLDPFLDQLIKEDER